MVPLAVSLDHLFVHLHHLHLLRSRELAKVKSAGTSPQIHGLAHSTPYHPLDSTDDCIRYPTRPIGTVAMTAIALDSHQSYPTG